MHYYHRRSEYGKGTYNRNDSVWLYNFRQVVPETHSEEMSGNSTAGEQIVDDKVKLFTFVDRLFSFWFFLASENASEHKASPVHDMDLLRFSNLQAEVFRGSVVYSRINLHNRSGDSMLNESTARDSRAEAAVRKQDVRAVPGEVRL